MIAGVFGGALLDRFNRRDVSIISDVISAASIAGLPVIEMTVGLTFEWFVVCGVIGAVGDIPGMTARDTLLPAVIDNDKLNLQRFLGVSQSIESLTVIIGPALAALGMSLLGNANTLWLTSALSSRPPLPPASFLAPSARSPPRSPTAKRAASSPTPSTAPRRDWGSSSSATPRCARRSSSGSSSSW